MVWLRCFWRADVGLTGRGRPTDYDVLQCRVITKHDVMTV
jgi:hypothetical protein